MRKTAYIHAREAAQGVLLSREIPMNPIEVEKQPARRKGSAAGRAILRERGVWLPGVERMSRK